MFSELAKQRQSSPTSTTTTTASVNIVETVVDIEDRLAKEFKNFKFMPSETGILYFNCDYQNYSVFFSIRG